MPRLQFLLAVFFVGSLNASTATSVLAVEDFRVAIKSIVPHLVVVRELRLGGVGKNAERSGDNAAGNKSSAGSRPKGSEAKVSASEQPASSAVLLDLLRSRPAAENFQHAFRVGGDLLATIDCNANFGEPDLSVGTANKVAEWETEWQLLTRDGVWHDIKLVAYDKVSRLVILRAPEKLLDKIAAGAPIEAAVPVGHWVDGTSEMGLPTVVVWYEGGAPRAKSTMIAATGNAMTRGLAALDFKFAPTQVGAPVLDADGRLLGLVAMQRSWQSTNDLERRFELKETELSESAGVNGDANSSSESSAGRDTPATIIISATASSKEQTADLIVPVNILNRLVEDVSSSDDLVILDFGLIGVRLGNGDATIRRVIAGGAAAEKDCKAGDKILSINGQEVRNDGDIINLVATYRAGDTLSLRLADSAATKSDEVTLEANATERTVDITMRGIRTRSLPARSKSGDSEVDGSSWLNRGPQMRESRLVGVVRDELSIISDDEEGERLYEEIVRLRKEIDALLKALNKQEQQN